LIGVRRTRSGMQRQTSADDSSNGDLQPNFSETYDPVSLTLS
jgi:hypothetical protein